jgi:heterotetrameric sarcosine oxidase delta subunit
MRITCPYCGDRDSEEFSIQGEVAGPRPSAQSGDAADIAAFHAYVHLRANDFGLTKEYWYHLNGCRRLLVVSRDTRNHAILDVTFAAAKSGGK